MILLYRFNIIVWLGDIVGAGWGVAPWYGGDGGNANVCRHIGGAKESQWTHYGTEKVGFYCLVLFVMVVLDVYHYVLVCVWLF